MELNMGRIIRNLRKQTDIGQDALANAVGVSVQAVSKWETGQSLPDVSLIPDIAKFFGVSTDHLFFGEDTEQEIDLPFPDDDALYIVQAQNGKVLGKDKWCKDKCIYLSLNNIDTLREIHIWGNAQIDGNVSGSINCGSSVNCGDVGGAVNAGDGVVCGNVGGAVNAGDGVVCGNIGGRVSAGDGVISGNIGGSVSAGDGINCGNIFGNAASEGDIHCSDINDAHNIKCNTIYAKGNIECSTLECSGDIHTERTVDIK